jgi:hypothetical protein
MNIYLLSKEQTVEYWPLLSNHFNKVLQYSQGESTVIDYLTKILNGVAQCWAVIDSNNDIVGAGLTEFLNYSQHKTLHIIAFSGSNFEEQSKVFPTIEQFARDTGCKAIEQWGRQGWAKVLPQYVPGFKQAYVVMRKDLE